MTPETKARMKKPGENKWNDFLANHKGMGYSSDQLRALYNQQKDSVNVRPKSANVASSAAPSSSAPEASGTSSTATSSAYSGPHSSADTVRTPKASAKPQNVPKAPPPPGHNPTAFAQSEVFDMNLVTEEQLKSISGMGTLLAKNYIATRKKLNDEEGRAFVSVKQLTLVKGIGKKTFEAIQHRFRVGNPSS